MSVQLDEIRIANFLSFGPEQNLHLDKQGLVLVEGDNRMTKKARSNAAGKSALLEALVWCLTGKTLRGLTADDVVNRREKKNCIVEITGSKDGSPFTVTRGRRVQNKNVLDFVLGGKNLTSQGDQKETQRQLKLYLGVDYDVFTNTSVFNGQDDQWRFTLLPDAARKAVLDKLLGLEQINRAHTVVRAEHHTLVDEDNHLRGKIDILNARASEKRAALQALKSTWKQQILERIEDCQRQIDRAEAKATNVDVDEKAYKAAKERLQVIAGEVVEADRMFASARDLRSDRSAKARLAKSTHQNAIRRVEDAGRQKLGVVCKSCGSEITKDSRAAHLRSLELEVEAALAASVVSEERAEVADAACVKAEKRLASLREELDAHKAATMALRASAAAGRERLLEVKRLGGEMGRLRRSLRAPPSDDLKRELDELGIAIVDMEVKSTELQERLAHVSFWVEGFGNAGVKSHLLDYVVPTLNQRAQRYANLLADGLTVEFDSESLTKKGESRDKFQVRMTNAQGSDSYEGNSGGEKRKVDVVVARTLQSIQEDRAGTSFNLAWYDEVFESLDATSAEAVVNLLLLDAKKYSSLFVVSHQDWLKSYFPRVLTVVKDGGFSFLAWS